MLNEIKAKREAATQGKWEHHWDHSIFAGDFVKGPWVIPLEGNPSTKNAEYIARMDPRTVEAMENIIRAAFPLTQESWPDGETPEFYRKELRKTFEALKQIGEIK